MPEMKTATEIADKQIRRLTEAIPDVEAGVNRVTESPTLKAAANLDKARAGYLKAIDSGKMERNLKAVDLETWKRKTLAKSGRIAEGITESRDTIVKFHEQRAVAQGQIDSKLAQMPTKTLQNNIQRAITQMTEMSQFSFDKSK